MQTPRKRFLVTCRHGKGIHIYPFAFTSFDSARYFAGQVLKASPQSSLAIMPEGEFMPEPTDSIYQIQDGEMNLPFMVEV